MFLYHLRALFHSLLHEFNMICNQFIVFTKPNRKLYSVLAHLMDYEITLPNFFPVLIVLAWFTPFLLSDFILETRLLAEKQFLHWDWTVNNVGKQNHAVLKLKWPFTSPFLSSIHFHFTPIGPFTSIIAQFLVYPLTKTMPSFDNTLFSLQAIVRFPLLWKNMDHL